SKGNATSSSCFLRTTWSEVAETTNLAPWSTVNADPAPDVCVASSSFEHPRGLAMSAKRSEVARQLAGETQRIDSPYRTWCASSSAGRSAAHHRHWGGEVDLRSVAFSRRLSSFFLAPFRHHVVERLLRSGRTPARAAA